MPTIPVTAPRGLAHLPTATSFVDSLYVNTRGPGRAGWSGCVRADLQSALRLYPLRSLSTDDPPVLSALAAGSTTITATKNGLSTTATLTVVGGTSLPDGTTRWSVAPTPGLEMTSPIYTHVVDETVPDLFTVESNAAGDEFTMRALSATGEQKWTEAAPGLPVMGDGFGGVVAQTLDEDDKPFGLARFAGPAEATPWRYEPAAGIGRPAQASDGTIYVVESQLGEDNHGDPIWDSSVVVIDGTTGQLRARVPVPRDFVEEACGSDRWEMRPIMTTPVVGADGFGYVQVRRRTRVDEGTCNGVFIPRAYDHQIQLLKMSPAGTVTWMTLYQFTGAADPFWPVMGQTMPDGLGGILATWSRYRIVAGQPVDEQRSLARFDADGVRVDRSVDLDMFIGMIGQAGTAYVSDESGVVTAKDATTWQTKWTSAVTGLLIAATPSGGAVLQDWLTGEARIVDANGQLEATQALEPIGVVQEFGGWVGMSTSLGLSMLAGVVDDATRWNESLGGDRQGRLELRNPGVGIFAKSHFVPGPFSAQHVSIRITPTNIGYWRGIMPTEFLPQDQYGNHFLTLGAGTPEGDSSLSCSGVLTKGLNRFNDVTTAPVELEKLAVGPSTEDALITALLSSHNNYLDDLPYACLPELNPGMYNSNSYAHGLLLKAGGPIPRFPYRGIFVPGWPTPVPPYKFDP
jgi:outer membrane protein assembly factor BamB